MRLRQYKGIFSSEKYNVQIQFVSFMDRQSVPELEIDYNLSSFQNGAYISEITLITLKVRLRQSKVIFTSETYNVPLIFVTCVDSHDSQNEESSTSGRASILVPIFSEITVNSLKCVRAKINGIVSSENYNVVPL